MAPQRPQSRHTFACEDESKHQCGITNIDICIKGVLGGHRKKFSCSVLAAGAACWLSGWWAGSRLHAQPFKKMAQRWHRVPDDLPPKPANIRALSLINNPESANPTAGGRGTALRSRLGGYSIHFGSSHGHAYSVALGVPFELQQRPE
jgi:hypothetical protein